MQSDMKINLWYGEDDGPDEGIEVREDPDGLGMVEIHYVTGGKIVPSSRITLRNKEDCQDLYNAISYVLSYITSRALLEQMGK